MAEYYVVLKKAVASMGPGAGEARRGVYEKARSALVGQLKAIDPPLSTAEISRQRLELEEAIRRVERESMAAPADDAFDVERSISAAAPRRASRSRLVYDEYEQEGEFEVDLDLDSEPEPSRRRRAGQARPQRAPSQRGGEREWAPSRAYEQPPADYDDYGDDEYELDREPERDDGREVRPEVRDQPAMPASGRAAGGGRTEPSLGAPPPDWAPAPETDSERAARGSRKERRQRAAPRMPGPREEEERPRRSLLPLILLIALLLAVGGAVAALFYAVPEARVLATQLIGSIEQAIGGGDAPSAPKADATDEKPAPAAPPVRTVGDNERAAAPAGPRAAQPAVPVAGRAVLFEESTTGGRDVSATLEGTVVWQFVEKGPDGGPQVQALVTIPGRSLKLAASMRPNTDRALPVSHLVEIAVTTPPGFPGGSIDAIPRLVLKESENAVGKPIFAVPTKVVDGLFLIALSNEKSDVAFNVGLLRSNGFIDIPLLYQSGQRAILTLAKGEAGARAFDQAFAAWGGG